MIIFNGPIFNVPICNHIPKTREKCTGRLKTFFDFIDIPTGSMPERSTVFCDRAKYDNGWGV